MVLQASRLPHNLQGVVLFQTAELLYFIRTFIRKYSIAHFFDKYNTISVADARTRFETTEKEKMTG